MKRLLLYLIIPLCLLFTACQNRKHHTEVLSEAARLSDSIPSQALMKLEEIKNVKRLSTPEQAEYNLIFIKSMLRSGNKLSSDSIIHATTQYYQEHNDSAGLHQALYYNGLYHYRNARHDSAVFYFDKAVKAVPAGNNNDPKAGYKRTAGYAYLYLEDAEAAVKTQKESLQYASASNDSLAVIYSLLSLADAYRYNKETDKSIRSYMQALDQVRDKGNRDLEADILNIVSGVYESDNRIAEALHYKNLSQEIKRSRQDVPATNLYRAILFEKQNNPDSARHYAQLAIKGNDQFVADLAYQLLGIWDAREGRYTEALNHSKNSDRIFNSFLSGIHSGDMQQKYEKEKLENENNQLKIKQQEHQLYLLMSAFLLLLMLIAIYATRVHGRRKNEKVKAENKMLRLKQENLLLKQQQEISALREKEAVLRESLFKRINFFHKLPSLSGDEDLHHQKQGKIKITGDDWQELINGVRDAYPAFLQKLKQHAPTLSDDDIRFCCLLKINVNTRDLSDIYCVSKAAITKRKYRLKTEKFQINDNTQNLDTILSRIN
ncbi:hypothetical protein [Proteiniphilum saccharofermentans]|uniref:tetratricopeptide repeat protein n=1 Tax=Proteiniphilum saccharofermentans TaxID=1642647 RepID=UPI0028A6DC28|nr:hypothetical protein [Proteiniphilum saccharofermentans]